MPKIFGDFDISDFWEPSEYAQDSYVDSPPTNDEIAAVERTLGYKLPEAYIELTRYQNGGIPRNTNHRTSQATSWAEDHIAITGIYSIGHRKHYSLCGPMNSHFWIDQWGYPPIGIYFADCPSAGHDMICLDYRSCGQAGEPQVVHIAQEFDYKITLVAQNFESFIRGLENDDAFEA
jgi:cell wall assembly regulator SMI1